MPAIQVPYDRARPSCRYAFPYTVEIRGVVAGPRRDLMVYALSGERCEGAFMIYVVRGDHIARGRYESTVFAFDHGPTAYRFRDRYLDDLW